MSTARDISAPLKAWRRRMDLSQGGAADLLRVGIWQIEKWETGRTHPPLAEALLQLMWFLEQTPRRVAPMSRVAKQQHDAAKERHAETRSRVMKEWREKQKHA